MIGSSGFRPNHEGEGLSRTAKKYVSWTPGARKRIKRRFWKQRRQEARGEARARDAG
jgi:hypothetical protein